MSLFCSDLDGTLVGNPETSERFRRAWGLVTECQLVYSSGRLILQPERMRVRHHFETVDAARVPAQLVPKNAKLSHYRLGLEVDMTQQSVEAIINFCVKRVEAVVDFGVQGFESAGMFFQFDFYAVCTATDALDGGFYRVPSEVCLCRDDFGARQLIP